MVSEDAALRDLHPRLTAEGEDIQERLDQVDTVLREVWNLLLGHELAKTDGWKLAHEAWTLAFMLRGIIDSLDGDEASERRVSPTKPGTERACHLCR